MHRFLLIFIMTVAVQVSDSASVPKPSNRIQSSDFVIFPGPTYRPAWAIKLLQPASTKPTTEKPTTQKPTREEPSTQKPTTKKLVTEEPYQDRPIWEDPGLGLTDPDSRIIVPELDISNDINASINCTLNSTPPTSNSMCCGVDALSNHRIIGGNTTLIEQHPWLVQIEYHDKNVNVFKRLCGGFLISGRYVLSAGHCFAGQVTKENTAVNVILGEHDAKTDGPDCTRDQNGRTKCTDGAIKVPIEKYRVHPKYFFDGRKNLNDIAIVRMSRNVEFTTYIRPICLPTSDITASPPPDLRFTTAGWGAIRHTIIKFKDGSKRVNMIYDDLKRQVDVPFMNTEECRSQYSFLTEGHICAGGERGKDSCRGDSGGPLMYQNDGVFEAVGIVSTASEKYPCGTENHVAVYTNVYRYMGWILENIKP